MKNKLSVIKKNGVYFCAVYDNAAGQKNRYTVYKFPKSPSGRVKIVGRELPFKDCKQLIKNLTNKL